MTFTTKCEFSIKSAGNLENAKKKFNKNVISIKKISI